MRRSMHVGVGERKHDMALSVQCVSSVHMLHPTWGAPQCCLHGLPPNSHWGVATRCRTHVRVVEKHVNV